MSSQQHRQLRYYRHQGSWRELQEFLPERLRLSDRSAPEEEFWDWNGHKIHLDRYRNPDAKAKVVLHHGVGTNGRQMTLILGAPLAKPGFESVAVDDLGFGLTDVAPGSKYTYHDWCAWWWTSWRTRRLVTTVRSSCTDSARVGC